MIRSVREESPEKARKAVLGGGCENARGCGDCAKVIARKGNINDECGVIV